VPCYIGPDAVAPDPPRAAMSDPFPCKWRHFEAGIVLWEARCDLRSALSYREVEELLRERGVWVDTCCWRGSRTVLPRVTSSDSTMPVTRCSHGQHKGTLWILHNLAGLRRSGLR
jgi:hypothetical protein